MRYLIDLPSNVIKEIRKLLIEKDYSNINEFILTSIENQIALEQSEMIDEDLFSSTIRMPKNIPLTQEKNNKQDFSTLLSIPKLDKIKVYAQPGEIDLTFPKTNYANEWLWGQVNRIFPIKLALRILLKMQNENDNSVRIEEFQKYASEIASKLGSQLNEIDNSKKRKRDEKTSTALPISGNEKSLTRFKNHFLIFRRTSDNILDGALARLKLANINIDGFVRLTKSGLDFAKLLNPIIDIDNGSNQTLSDEEINYYINHIKNNVIEELTPFKTILNLINKGIKDVHSMNNEIMRIKKEWTETTTTTQRAGTLGRLFELGLVEKEKKGVNVFYKLSPKANQYNLLEV